MSELDLAAFKAKLSGIESEHSTRMAEARQKFDESTKATQESHDKFADRKQRLTSRLREMARNQRGEGKDRNKELSFGLEDETAGPHDDLAEELAQIEKERQARELRAQSEGFMRGPNEAPQHQVRQPPVVQQPVAPPPPVRQPPPPRRQRPPVDDDDDLSNQSWLS
ncbi:hypothetical protein SK803_19250 [Lentzea sp. BCCO 10_0856]|uniref:Uncharacterized protein n=1 Tax=Lentzea miocenica TaxID=3095431 RepID=A0ABU4T2H8_9PSEU|nr:hypothetical protein [Lentzea sp. BCCO 10_0856]MDX8032357.1 hypothetical protein [Lentzea sp. BCCO 10_0856]